MTAGNANAVVTLPPMDTVIGYPEVANVIAGGWAGSLAADGSIPAEIQVITGATNELGFGLLTQRASEQHNSIPNTFKKGRNGHELAEWQKSRHTGRS